MAVKDKGIRHAGIKPASPQLNGKVVRSHPSDQEFYQILTYKGDVDLETKLDEWERFFCNLARPHGAFKGKIPCEALKTGRHRSRYPSDGRHLVQSHYLVRRPQRCYSSLAADFQSEGQTPIAP